MSNDLTASGSRKVERDDDGSNWWKWVLGVPVLIALVVGGFFLLGGDVDVDVDAPDISVGPGSIDIDDGDADVDE